MLSSIIFYSSSSIAKSVDEKLSLLSSLSNYSGGLSCFVELFFSKKSLLSVTFPLEGPIVICLLKLPLMVVGFLDSTEYTID